jgi:lytic murein transglycosylase
MIEGMRKQRQFNTIYASIFAVAILASLSFATLSRAEASPTEPAVKTASCQTDQKFNPWLAELKKDAIAKGVSEATWQSALPLLKPDPRVIRRDHAQSVFQQTFLQFSDRMASIDRMKMALVKIKANRKLFDRIESEFGVPAPVLASFWGLESNFNAFTGKFSILTAVTTLAYDCRRADFFREQLIDALLVVERGDLTADQMIGNWAGEIGGTQLTPKEYLKYGVDYDGDGKVDLVNSIPDTLATAANFLRGQGWQKTMPWLQEVTVPAKMPWQEAEVSIHHPMSYWMGLGVTGAHKSLPVGNDEASLFLPMGRFGPAFLAYPNFQSFLGWNSSITYSLTAAYLAARIDGAPAINRPTQIITPLTAPEMIELQTWLNAHGYNIGKVDGKLGSGTRAAVKQLQLKFNLPADSYPTAELLPFIR